jgi:hypothetical protein
MRTLMLIVRPGPPSPSLPFSRIVHSYLYERPAMEEVDTVFLAGIQKSNDLDVHARQFACVQRNPRLNYCSAATAGPEFFPLLVSSLPRLTERSTAQPPPKALQSETKETRTAVSALTRSSLIESLVR